MSDRPNTPVPDELAQVRAEQKRLKEREDVLKRILLTQPDTREGTSWLAEIRVTQRKEIDWKSIDQLYPEVAQVIADNTHPKPVTSVVLSGVTEDGEIVSASKMRAIGDSSQ